MLISIIVPIYNVAPYLRQCLDSILSQSYSRLEIILVNDGSTDESENIAREYLYDPRVCLISQSNAGLSGARNRGLSEARGDYIAFVDSDDYLSPRFLEGMLKVVLENKAEFVCNDNICYFYDVPKPNPVDLSSIKVCIPDSSNLHFGGAVWRFLFAKSFLDRCGVKFLEGKVYEDEAFLYMLAPFARCFVRFKGEPYFYRRREGSIMDRYASFRSYDLLDVFEAIYLFYQEHRLLETFAPPYSFLCDCAIGYKNEQEYLCRSKALAERLGISENLFVSPPPYRLSAPTQKLLQKDFSDFQKWLKVHKLLKKLRVRLLLRGLANFIKRSVRFAKRKLKF